MTTIQSLSELTTYLSHQPTTDKAIEAIALTTHNKALLIHALLYASTMSFNESQQAHLERIILDIKKNSTKQKNGSRLNLLFEITTSILIALASIPLLSFYHISLNILPVMLSSIATFSVSFLLIRYVMSPSVDPIVLSQQDTHIDLLCQRLSQSPYKLSSKTQRHIQGTSNLLAPHLQLAINSFSRTVWGSSAIFQILRMLLFAGILINPLVGIVMSIGMTLVLGIILARFEHTQYKKSLDQYHQARMKTHELVRTISSPPTPRVTNNLDLLYSFSRAHTYLIYNPDEYKRIRDNMTRQQQNDLDKMVLKEPLDIRALTHLIQITPNITTNPLLIQQIINGSHTYLLPQIIQQADSATLTHILQTLSSQHINTQEWQPVIQQTLNKITTSLPPLNHEEFITVFEATQKLYHARKDPGKNEFLDKTLNLLPPSLIGLYCCLLLTTIGIVLPPITMILVPCLTLAIIAPSFYISLGHHEKTNHNSMTNLHQKLTDTQLLLDYAAKKPHLHNALSQIQGKLSFIDETKEAESLSHITSPLNHIKQIIALSIPISSLLISCIFAAMVLSFPPFGFIAIGAVTLALVAYQIKTNIIPQYKTYIYDMKQLQHQTHKMTPYLTATSHQSTKNVFVKGQHAPTPIKKNKKPSGESLRPSAKP